MARSDPATPILVLSAAEVGSLLGLDQKSVYAAARRGEIPCRRVGRRYLFGRQAIETWLADPLSRPRDTLIGPTSRGQKKASR